MTTKHATNTFDTYQTKDIEKASEIALYYGFKPIARPEIEKEDHKIAAPIKEAHLDRALSLTTLIEEKIALLRQYIKHDMRDFQHPVMTSYHSERIADNKIFRFNLDIIGDSKSISEGLLIKAALSILEEDGHTNVTVHINSLGDRQSFEQFEHELAKYCRKNIADLSVDTQQAIRKNIFSVLSHSECEDIRQDAPRPINFLSEPSRRHFKEVLEYLEHINVPYEINDFLVDNKHYCNETIFEIRTGETEEVIASGVRYNSLVKKMGFRREVPAIGIHLHYKRKRKSIQPKKMHIKRLRDPKFYFVHLGFEAKLRSLRIIDELRREAIPVRHSITKDKCAGQIASAEKLCLPYVLIFGIKEAMDNSIIIRDMKTRSQRVVPLHELKVHLKKLT